MPSSSASFTFGLCFIVLFGEFRCIKISGTLCTLRLGPIIQMNMTKDHTTKGRSSVVRRSRDPGPRRKVSGGHHGHGRKLWQGTRPCHGSRQRQRMRINGDSEFHDHDGSPRGSPKTLWVGGTRVGRRSRGTSLGAKRNNGMVEASDEVEWMFWCLEEDSCHEERGTSQAPCFAEIRNVSPGRIHSPVRSVPAPRTCHTKGSI